MSKANAQRLAMLSDRKLAALVTLQKSLLHQAFADKLQRSSLCMLMTYGVSTLPRARDPRRSHE